jgi:hypothetical protein
MIRDYLEWNFDAKNHRGCKPRNHEDYVAFHVPSIEGKWVAQDRLFIVVGWVAADTWSIANFIG